MTPERQREIALRSVLASRDHITNPPVRSAVRVPVADKPLFGFGAETLVGITAVLERIFLLTGLSFDRRRVERAIRGGQAIKGLIFTRVAMSRRHADRASRMAE